MPLSLQEFLSLRTTLPLVDVRSEGEYDIGHIAGAQNIPLLNNQERVVVGTAYKQKGQTFAIREGFRLVGPRLLEIIEATEQLASGSELLIYCWRGGMRSQNFSQFASMARIKTQVLKGGYKTYRQFAYEYFERPLKLMLIGGCTGSGKSEILRALKANGEQVLDLETLAHHKGSAFGGLMMPAQPSTEQFHNKIFEELFQLDLQQCIWVEDESITIGKVFLPPPFWDQMKNAKIVELNVPKATRIKRLVAEYGHAPKEDFLASMEKINKRLGGQHFKEAKEKWLAGDAAATIDVLLTYYDKYYSESLQSKGNRVIAKLDWGGGEMTALLQNLVDL